LGTFEKLDLLRIVGDGPKRELFRSNQVLDVNLSVFDGLDYLLIFAEILVQLVLNPKSVYSSLFAQ